MSKARSTRVSRPDAGRCWLRCLRCLAQMLGPLRCWLRCLRCLAQITPIEGIEAQSAQHTGEPLLARPPRLPLSAGQMLAEMLTQMLGQMLGPLRCWLRSRRSGARAVVAQIEGIAGRCGPIAMTAGSTETRNTGCVQITGEHLEFIWRASGIICAASGICLAGSTRAYWQCSRRCSVHHVCLSRDRHMQTSNGLLGLLAVAAKLAGLAGLICNACWACWPASAQQLPASASPVRAPLSMVQRLK
jgi:hypothetical protein